MFHVLSLVLTTFFFRAQSDRFHLSHTRAHNMIAPTELVRPDRNLDRNRVFMATLTSSRRPDRRKGPNPLLDTEKTLLRGEGWMPETYSSLPPLPPLPPPPQADEAAESKRRRRRKEPPPSQEKVLAAEWKQVLGDELRARQVLCKAQKELMRTCSESALAETFRERRRAVRQMKEEHDVRTGSKLLRSLERQVPRASREEMTEYGVLLLEAFARIKLEHGWYKLYRFIDENGDGRIEYEELREFTRQTCRIPPSQVSDERIQSIWCTVDEDRSGWWDMKEFSHMMRPAEERLVITKEGGGLKVKILPPPPKAKDAAVGKGSGANAALPAVKAKAAATSFTPSPEIIYAREQAMLNVRSAMDEVGKKTRAMAAEAERIEGMLKTKRQDSKRAVDDLRRSRSLPALT